MQHKWVFALLIFILGVVFWQQGKIHAKTFLFLTREFPFGVQPLVWVTSKPVYREIIFQFDNKEAVGSLLIPTRGVKIYSERSLPAVVLAMGVRTKEEDRPTIFKFADTLARLGYVVFWPRSAILNEGVADFEDPRVFIRAFELVKNIDVVNPERISFIGFSVGSSVALVAATNETIRNQVRSIVFFGGYYNVRDYLSLLELGNGWNPDEGAVSHLREILREKGVGSIKELKDDSLDIIDPSKHIADLQAKVFILHDKGDHFVPYHESEKLYKVLPERQVGQFVLVNLFEHVQPKKVFTLASFGEFIKIYSFVYNVLSYL